MITSKECIICHKTKRVGSYYIHRENKVGYDLDNSCKECSKKFCMNLEGLKKYCNVNSRKFSQELYNIATDSATKKYKDDVEFNSLPEKKRESFLFQKIINIYFSRQSQNQYYECTSKDTIPNLVVENTEPLDEVLEPTKKSKEKKIYSEKWGGTYSRSQISWLDTYYEDTKNDFSIVSRIHSDYAKKIAKASLNMDESFDEMMNGVSGADKRYKDAKAVFDTLSISAKFSEKTRGQNDVSGFGSLSEIVMQLENTGFLQKKITYPDDDIEKINADLRWVLSSVGGDL